MWSGTKSPFQISHSEGGSGLPLTRTEKDVVEKHFVIHLPTYRKSLDLLDIS